jgi:hypothetical protein
MAHMKAIHTPSEDIGRIAQKQASQHSCCRTALGPSTASTMKPGPAVAKYFKGEISVGRT